MTRGLIRFRRGRSICPLGVLWWLAVAAGCNIETTGPPPPPLNPQPIPPGQSTGQNTGISNTSAGSQQPTAGSGSGSSSGSGSPVNSSSGAGQVAGSSSGTGSSSNSGGARSTGSGSSGGSVQSADGSAPPAASDGGTTEAGESGDSESGDSSGACDYLQCFRAFRCVTSCAGPVTYTGCCPCSSPTFDESVCVDGSLVGQSGGCTADPGGNAMCGGSRPQDLYRCVFPYFVPLGCQILSIGNATDTYCCP
jgi:hypothetical protein